MESGARFLVPLQTDILLLRRRANRLGGTAFVGLRSAREVCAATFAARNASATRVAPEFQNSQSLREGVGAWRMFFFAQYGERINVACSNLRARVRPG